MLDTPTDFSIRLNKVLASVKKIDSGSAEYSFTFELPSTATNNKVFGFANALPTSGKFMRRYPAIVDSDEQTVFQGTLLLTQFDAAAQKYSANLISIKVNTVEDIFGDMTLFDLDWSIPYDGAPTINRMNATDDKVYFPLVAYGVFEKDPVFSDEVADDYTDRLILDDTTRFYHETFYPSLNLVELVKRLFAQKGYDLSGDIFDDEVLKNIYTSVSLASSQPLEYNIGLPKMGSVDLSVSWSNKQNNNRLWQPTTQDLHFKYHHMLPFLSVLTNNTATLYNEIDIYNILSDGGTVTENIDSYAYDNDECCIVIPADGCYRFELDITATLDTTWNNGKINAVRKAYDRRDQTSLIDIDFETNDDISFITPIEIQLVKNVLNDNANIELIKGRFNRDWRQPYVASIGQYTYQAENFEGMYPHEQMFAARNPTNIVPPSNDGDWNKGIRQNYSLPIGYMPRNADCVLAYDPWVSNNFICGFTTYLGGGVAVTKNGKSWYRGQTTYTNSLYNSAGYDYREDTATTQNYKPTQHNTNSYPDAQNCTYSIVGNTLTGKVVCAVWLNKNDMLTLNCIHRHWEPQTTGGNNKARYVTNVNARLKMNAFTPRDYSYVLSEGLGYNTPTQFDTELQLGHFLSNERRAADFINDFIKSFNLQYTQNGKTVQIDRGKVDISADGKAIVDLDGKCSWQQAKWQKPDYPSEYGVKFSTDTNSWGYWLTVPNEHRNDYNWKDYGDPGYDVVPVDPDGSSSNSISVQTEVTRYDTFTLERDNQNTPLLLPVIGDYEVLAPGANYGDAMEKDCLDKRMRYWFRDKDVKGHVKLVKENETVNIYTPVGEYNNTTLDYKDTEGSLLHRYFNTTMDIRKDIVTVGVKLDAREFYLLSVGANVKFDNSLYRVIEIQGYDPSGRNETTLQLMAL